jgi:hypothetical protein
MAFSTYDASVPVYSRILGSLAAILDKAAAFAEDKKIKPEVLIAARLYPDMWSLGEQVRGACNHAVRGGARLSKSELPAFEGADATLADLKARIDWTLAFISGLKPAAFAGAEDREIVFPAGKSERRMSGRDYLLAFSMPNFMFHATAAYAILRHNGVPLHKNDFLGEGA